MKRRTAEGGKLRRTLKRNKIPDSVYGSLFMYLKFFIVWLLVLMADFILEFRFEYLWPFWLLLRSVYDSFKYQGLAFSVFFVCIALTSDMICFLFIPIHWLFFAASTYVWVQFVWHTERGICLPTVSLWLLFVYIEACVRLKELKSFPFHLDLCRPFAAHCIGYPVVTLGFGFKSYVGYRIRQRKQKEVAKENDFYTQLLMQALPKEPSITSFIEKAPAIKAIEEVVSNGVHGTTSVGNKRPNSTTSASRGASSSTSFTSSAAANAAAHTATSSHSDASKFSEIDPREAKKQLLSGNGHLPDRELEYMENHRRNQSPQPTSQQQQSKQQQQQQRATSVNDYDESIELVKDKSFKVNGVVASSTTSAAPTTSSSSKTAGAASGARWNHNHHHHHHQQQPLHVKDNKENVAINIVAKRAKNLVVSSTAKENNTANNNHVGPQKDEHALRLESDIKRLKADLQASRQVELDFRSKVAAFGNDERVMKSELSQLQQDNDNLQTKLHGLVTARQHDKHMVASLEKKLQEERKSKAALETQLVTERKALKKSEEAVAAAVAAAVRLPATVVVPSNTRSECTDACKARRRDLEQENKQLRREYKMCEERFRQAEREAQTLHQYKESHNESEVLMSALAAMQEKNTHLESSLSAETRLKLDLFCALGEAKRQLEITQSFAMQKEKEVEDLKSRVAEVMAVMPPSFSPVGLDSALHSSPHYTSKFVTDDTMITASTLDPNASVYTPKCGGPPGHGGHHHHHHGAHSSHHGPHGQGNNTTNNNNGGCHLSPLSVVDM